ncbi:hypothetical protein FQN50_008699 [Emmonsiellopsis sp. PD_5]|nr:hypothetical protein FQN50_008699 [Emmonsiellopsis sp. PD_5]
MEEPDARLISQIPQDAKVLLSLSLALVRIAQADTGLSDQESPAGSLPVIIQRLNQAIARSDIIWQLGSTVVLALDSGIVMKFGYGIDTDHIPTMEYIKNRARQLPIPEIHGVLRAGRRSFVFMTRIQGEPLDQIWKTLCKTEKESIKQQLESIFSSVRSLPPPPSDEPRAVLGGGVPKRCKDARRDIRVAEHPIENEAEFNGFLTSHSNRTETGSLAMIRSFLTTDHKFAMTHGDLHPRNIMIVKSDVSAPNLSGGWVKITGLLDWEMCGYYPEYWEYVKALHTIRIADEFDDWWAYLPVSVGSWPREYAVDQLISRWWG